MKNKKIFGKIMAWTGLVCLYFIMWIFLIQWIQSTTDLSTFVIAGTSPFFLYMIEKGNKLTKS